MPSSPPILLPGTGRAEKHWLKLPVKGIVELGVIGVGYPILDDRC